MAALPAPAQPKPAASAPPVAPQTETRIDKIEPPSWWLHSTWMPVRLLVRGVGLSGAKLVAQPPLRATVTKANARGTYLFAELSIPTVAQPGPYKLTFTFANGATKETNFDVLAPPTSTPARGFDPNDLIYLAMPDRFANGDTTNDNPAVSRGLLDRSKPRYYHGGDFQGIVDHIAYLKELGVSTLWLNPWYDNNNALNEKERYDNQPMADYHGYGAIDYYGVEEHFGTMAQLQSMVKTLQQNGIKVMQDQVANHVGPYHPWVADAPTPTWFNGTAERHPNNTWQVWTMMDPHATKLSKRDTLDGWFIDLLPDMNQSDFDARRYEIQNALWWAGITGIDSIRQDTMPYVPRDFWREWSAALRREFPRLRTVGEVFDGDPALTAVFQGGRRGPDGLDTGYDSVFDFPLYFALRSAFARNGDLREVPRVLAHDFLYPNPPMLVTFLGNHDVQRFMHEPGATHAGLRMAFTALFTLRGVPLVYYGDEIGMDGAGDPDNRRDFPGGWPGDARNAFTQAGRTAEEDATFRHVQTLARIRRASPALRDGKTMNLLIAEKQWVYAREIAQSQALVAYNTAAQNVDVEIDATVAHLKNDTRLIDLLDRNFETTVAGGRVKIALGARASRILVAAQQQ